MTQQATLGKAATILTSVGLLSTAAFAQDGALSQDRAGLVAHTPGVGGAAAGLWYAPVDFEGEMRGVLFNDSMQPEFEVEAMLTQLIAFDMQKVPGAPAELMEGFIYGDVYRVAAGLAPRELVGRLEGSWQGNQHGAGEFLAIMYHARMSQEVAGLFQGEFRGASAADGSLIGSTSDSRSFGAPPPVQVGSHTAQQLTGGLAGIGASQPGIPPADGGCTDVTACAGKHGHTAERIKRQQGAGLRRVLNDSPGTSWTGSQIGGQQGAGPLPPTSGAGLGGTSAAGASLVPEEAQPARFHGRWKLFL